MYRRGDERKEEGEVEMAVKGLWGRMLPELLECTKKEIHLDNLCGILDATGDAIKEMGCEMNEGELEMLMVELKVG